MPGRIARAMRGKSYPSRTAANRAFAAAARGVRALEGPRENPGKGGLGTWLLLGLAACVVAPKLLKAKGCGCGGTAPAIGAPTSGNWGSWSLP